MTAATAIGPRQVPIGRANETSAADGLQSYSNCPGRTSAACRFANEPQIALAVPELDGATATVHRCSTCGIGVTRPAMPDVSSLYDGRQSEDFQDRDSGLATKIKSIAFRSLARRLIKRLSMKPRLVIDYACGNGVLTSAFAHELPDAKIIGLDFFDSGPRGMGPAGYVPFSRASSLEGRADLLLCFHALEHDDDPHAFLRRLIAFVRPGGLLVIEVPNVDCVWTPWFGAACNNWYLPFHRLHFSRQSVRNLMQANGLTVVLEQDVCSATIAMSLSRWLGLKYNALFFVIGCAFRPVQLAAEKISRRPSALRIVVQRN